MGPSGWQIRCKDLLQITPWIRPTRNDDTDSMYEYRALTRLDSQPPTRTPLYVEGPSVAD